MSFCCAFVLLVGLARARCPSKFAYVRRAFYSNRRAPGDMRAKKRPAFLLRSEEAIRTIISAEPVRPALSTPTEKRRLVTAET